MPEPPRLPEEMLLRYTDVPEGRIRTRVLGRRRPDALPVVVVQGMAVSDYLLPACAALGAWTEVHLFDVPGYGGSGQPARRLDVRGYGEALVHWLEAAGLDRAIVVGHSSGTQVAAWAGVLAGNRVAAVGLASPTIDPVARPLPRLFYRWRLDARSPSPGLVENHVPEWKRAGVRGALHLVRVHLADRIEEQVARLEVPLLVIRAEDDRLTTEGWVRGLTASANGEFVTVPGAHAFLWLDPEAWSGHLRALSSRAG
jgi:pimeloyl-ACP methyl ester carboxylesterase